MRKSAERHSRGCHWGQLAAGPSMQTVIVHVVAIQYMRSYRMAPYLNDFLFIFVVAAVVAVLKTSVRHVYNFYFLKTSDDSNSKYKQWPKRPLSSTNHSPK